MVSCNKTIHAAVGDPQLMVTIRCRWKKLAREGGAASGLPDETASMSTDTTGSRMTANLSSFLRFKFTGKGNEEQDLRGFESAGSLGGAPPGNGNGPPAANGNRGSVAGDPLNKVMDTIQESHDEPAEPVFAGQLTPGGSRALTPQTSVKQLTPASSSQLAEPSPHASGANAIEAAAAGLGGMSLREMHAARAKAAVSGTPSPRRLDPGTGDSYGAGGRSPAEGSRAYPGSSMLPAAGSNLSLAAASAADSDLLVALRFELLTVAALEAGVYMARRPPGVGLGALTQSSSGLPPGGTPPSASPVAAGMSAAKDPTAVVLRAAHAPARRLARTVLCMGSADGPHFGASALRVIRAQVASAGDGLDVLSYWWSNAVHMRAMLGGLSLAAAAAGVLAPAGGGMGLAVAAAVSAGGASVGSLGGGIASLGGAPGSAPGNEHWAAAALVPELKRLERAVFQELLGRMWERVLLPTVLGRAGGPRAAAPAAATKRALQEAAIKKWFEGLEAVCAALTKQVTGGHSALLRQQVLLAALKRVDLLLFAHLLGGADQPGVTDLLTDYDPHGSLAVSATGPAAAAPGSAAAAVAAAAVAAGGAAATGGAVIPQLDEASLPFAKGVLTFGGGMSVKMTVTRLQQWAAGQPLLGGGASSADAGLAGAGTAGAGGAVMGAGAGPGPLFPLLRAAADLLMMPKEMLVDRAVRLDVGAALSMRSVLHILERFQPDEFAQDSISPAILESLQEDAALPQIHLRSAAADANGGYVPPPDAAVLRGVETGSEPGLEYDADSEDELEELAQVVAKSPASSGAAVSPTVPPGGAAMAVRFRLLHDSWAAGMPRRRTPPSVASGSGVGI
ncbi:hypothetical protein HXX76_011512 [Chlamydomonas incerta]|uniref:Dilute domain-containing protein n=1 Tax=Chlamydomonas incerta TaxID=51695 RepID=A0A835SKF3_CHLIN|nr:hypothetical protein HXX76_011512 [Chlamydomonas incerta]|eukprot:KAG2428812.1 hypothetical protein HXX76_011512 [Chlamydomonas incerta]